MNPSHQRSVFGASLGLMLLTAGSCAVSGHLGTGPTSEFAAGLGDPAGIAIAPSGEVFVADTSKGELVVFDAMGKRLRTVGSGLLQSPLGVAIDMDGTVLVSDSMQDKVFRFAARGTLLSSFGKSGDGEGEFSGAGPLDIAPNGDLYVVDIDHNRVQVFDSTGKFRFAFGKEGHFGDSAPGELYFPGGVAIDRGGEVYVVDTHNFRVQVFSATGRFERLWGRQGTWFGEFDHAFGIAIGAKSDLVYVVDDHIKLDGGGLRVRVFTRQGEARGWLAPPRGQAPLHHPFDVAVASDGRLLVSERNQGRIRVLDPKDLRIAPHASGASSRPASQPTSRRTAQLHGEKD